MQEPTITIGDVTLTGITFDEWLEALRSGDFNQAQDVLRHDDRFCCLGVACELVARKNPDKCHWDDIGQFFVQGKAINFVSLPPKEIIADMGLQSDAMYCNVGAEWSGEPDANVYIHMDVDGVFMKRSVADLNDSGRSFKDIADLMKSHRDQILQ